MAPNLVLLHGFTNTGASWDQVVGALPERYRPVAPDIRGHGSAADARPVSLPGVIADVSALGTSPFDLVGYSMGGRLALHAALALPGRVRRLVLIGASPGIADPAARAERRSADERLAGEVEEMTIEDFAQRWAQTAVLSGQPAAVKAAVHADRLRNTPAGLAAALRGLGTAALASLWERLAEVTVPVELVVGERDEKFRAIGEEMAAGLPEARVHVVGGAGHAVHLEAPGAVADVIAGSAG
ncbi:MAG TPA: 2-succinyl-6-hydroxy-2,4-cyclohexadiene-1-carboxylate synthase [Solirubrobacteraceae bacterium]|nr:2-succinyl-6-hydroxy-2,4-cyclohexadiene-1-carboxylate synthase [Solirubrobacteraceae bacterium]